MNNTAQATGRKDIFTISVLHIESDEYVDNMPTTTTTYYLEDEAINEAEIFLLLCPTGYKVFINYGEYEIESGDIFGEIDFTNEITA